MDAIEIYTKILEAVKGEKFQDVSTALSFAQNKVQEYYWQKRDALNRSNGQILGGGLTQAGYTGDCAVKADANLPDYKVLED